ncbi:hypothetical protein LCGC14_0970330 [marine sediment metagenome]|uniref:Uncharacterized protein n=1 Tax=marine sediment metagenome TaxID=412755 RepID=A0A0F9NBX8_9ZZZZ
MELKKRVLKTVKDEILNLQKLLDEYYNVIKLIKKAPIDNCIIIEKIISNIEKIIKKSNLNIEIKNELDSFAQLLYPKISEWKEKFKRNFGIELENLLKIIGFELKGNYPLLKTSLYSLEIDFDKSQVVMWYGPKQEKLEFCDLNTETIIQEIKKHNENITKRDFIDDQFLSVLKKAYNISVYQMGKKEGDSIPIMDVLLNYIFLIQKKKFRENPDKMNYFDYNRVLFSYDLYKLKKRILEKHELNLITATRAFTKNHSDFIWIPSTDKGDGNYISHILFREIKNE